MGYGGDIGAIPAARGWESGSKPSAVISGKGLGDSQEFSIWGMAKI